MALSCEAHFPADYAKGRARFLRAAETRGAQLASHPLSVRGPDGGELAVDTAYLGPEAPARVLAISSGIHGVEGYAGSAIQHRLLTEQLDGFELASDTGLLLVHALNPHGFAHRRRVNESNVDLNRNFLVHPDEHVGNPAYDDLYSAINPADLDEACEHRSRETLLGFAKDEGFGRLQEVLTCGQYVHAEGVQFGGTGPEASNRILRQVAAHETRGARQVAWLDVHTGLGPYGVPEMITECPPDHPAYARGKAWFGDRARSTLGGESVSAPLHGVMERGLEEAVGPECELTAYAVEFGTYDGMRVFWAMRADNWLAHSSSPDEEAAAAIKDEIVEVFRPDDAAWSRSVLDEGAAVLEAARRGLCASTP